jgi:phosphopantothenoylcysteine decarboxylase/phosphopantothenate--cysteine ligase
MSKILLGVSASIAAYKALEFVRLATAAGHVVRVVQTPASQRFVGAASFEALTGAPVLSDEFERDPMRGTFVGEQPPEHQPLSHLALVEKADLYLIAPASANTLSKLATGAAENLLGSCALAAACPVAIAPAMNNRMYEHPATQANLELLRERGIELISPDAGRLASIGEQGVGRLAEPARLLEACERLLAGVEPSGAGVEPSAAWEGVRVLVSAGGTREPLDSVRFLGNSSSGRMGLALAEQAHDRGARVTVVAANVDLRVPAGIEVVRVGTAAELKDACEQHFERCDVLLMAAAVADFRPSNPVAEKIKKEGRGGLTIELEPTDDVIRGLADRRAPGQTLVAFAAEHGEGALENARRKLTGKHVDAVVLNDISRSDIGFDSTDNEVTILTESGAQLVPRADKQRIAAAILDAVESLRG